MKTIATIDIGVKTFTWCVMVWGREEGRTPAVLDFGTHSLVEEGAKAKSRPPMELRKELIGVLDREKELFSTCDMIAVEHQYVVRGGGNIVAVKLAEVCITYFLVNFPEKEIKSMAGSKIVPLGGPKGLKKPQRKKWVCKWADEYLQTLDQSDFHERYASHPKQDDIADTFAMNCVMAKRLKLLE